MNVLSCIETSPPLTSTVAPSVSVRPKLLWVDLMVDSGLTGLSKQFSRNFDVVQSASVILDAGHVGGEAPSFIFFEYDYPDCQSLKLLRDTQCCYPDVPIVMLTLQHSEELAVWALRSRVWDYYVKPLSKSSCDSLSREIVKLYKNNGIINRRKSTSIDCSYPNDVRFKKPDQGNEVIDVALNYIKSNYSEKITEKYIAELCDLSRFQFSRLFKKIKGETFQGYLLNLRINKAKELLKNPNAKVVDVAYTVGFTDPSYFTRTFGRLTGLSPSDFRRVNITK